MTDDYKVLALKAMNACLDAARFAQKKSMTWNMGTMIGAAIAIWETVEKTGPNPEDTLKQWQEKNR